MVFVEKLRTTIETSRANERIRQLDLESVYFKFLADQEKYGVPEARRRRRALLEMNIAAYVQEACGWQQVNQYATRIYKKPNEELRIKNKTQLGFQDTQYDDVIRGWEESLEGETSPLKRNRYASEFSSWQELWRLHTFPLEHLIGCSDQVFIFQQLSALGFTRQKITTSVGLASLFEDLHPGEKVEVWQSPQPVMTASPSFSLYHQGETTIARYSKIYYLPSLNEFVILEEGLFTGYQNNEIKEFLSDDAQAKELPNRDESFFTHFAFLRELIDENPHGVFQHFVEKIGYFPQIKVGRGVKKDGFKDVVGALSYCEAILDFEVELCRQRPELAQTVGDRFNEATEIVRHHLLDSNSINIDQHLQNYIDTYAESNPEELADSTQQLRRKTAAIYPQFLNRIESLIDCTKGEILGGIKGLDGLPAGVNGLDGLALLKQAESQGFHTREELVEFCKKFGKNPDLFSKVGECAMCHKKTYIWPSEKGGCNVCPVCEVKDDLGLGALPDVKEKRRPSPRSYKNHSHFENVSGTVSLNPLIASVGQGTEAFLQYAELI